MRITADHLKGLGVIDEIVPEPVGGAHRHRDQAIAAAGKSIAAALLPLRHLSPSEIRQQRRQKFLQIGRSLGA
jgi:acetyl-CoA carboxylase carboxyl transferase subunit alpha